MTIENSIGRIKQYVRMIEPYGGTEDEINAELNIVAGLANLHLMMTLQRGSHKMRKRFIGGGDGDSTSLFDEKVSEHVRCCRVAHRILNSNVFVHVL